MKSEFLNIVNIIDKEKENQKKKKRSRKCTLLIFRSKLKFDENKDIKKESISKRRWIL